MIAESEYGICHSESGCLRFAFVYLLIETSLNTLIVLVSLNTTSNKLINSYYTRARARVEYLPLHVNILYVRVYEMQYTKWC